jgi:hypothetical protein
MIEEKILLSIAGVLLILLGIITYNVIGESASDEVTITCKVEQ